MGAFWATRIEILGTLSEYAGQKAGLVLGREELREHLDEEFRDVLDGDDSDRLRFRAEEYEEMATSLLYHLGVLPDKRNLFAPIALYHRYKHDPSASALAQAVMQLLNEMFPDLQKASGDGPIDTTPFVEESARRHGVSGLRMALEYYELFEANLIASPWSHFRRVEWKDAKDLAGLFKSESLETLYGTFLDQRYIDYLAKNFESIDRMNWRKFEGLTSEFFTREGYYVEIGKGRDDDNIDARIWKARDEVTGPPLALVQCKRQKEDVGKVVVKALWADIQEEKAKSGLIVTTSRLAPGAQKVATARSYPISQVTKPKLKEWLEKMRTPLNGIFMGE